VSGVFIIAEHRQGKVVESTYEGLTCGEKIAKALGCEAKVILLSDGNSSLKEEISRYSGKVISVEDECLENFTSSAYLAFLVKFIDEYGSGAIFVVPHTSFGMELIPSLSARTGIPCITDVIDVGVEGEHLKFRRNCYNGKVIAEYSVDASRGVFLTFRTGVYEQASERDSSGEVEKLEIGVDSSSFPVEFVEYREAPAGEVDITQAPILLSIGRGIKDQDNIPKAMEVAEKMGAVLACSRPVVDKKWLGKERQVGTSGKTVKPKAYIAMGISGAFQHVAGIKGAGVFIAVNRDPKAPIFRVADYGVVEDMFKVLDALKEKLGS